MQRFSNLLFLLLFKLQELLYKETLTQKPSMEVGIAGLFKWLVERGGSMSYTLENDWPGPADPKFHRTGESLKELFPNCT